MKIHASDDDPVAPTTSPNSLPPTFRGSPKLLARFARAAERLGSRKEEDEVENISSRVENGMYARTPQERFDDEEPAAARVRNDEKTRKDGFDETPFVRNDEWMGKERFDETSRVRNDERTGKERFDNDEASRVRNDEWTRKEGLDGDEASCVESERTERLGEDNGEKVPALRQEIRTDAWPRKGRSEIEFAASRRVEFGVNARPIVKAWLAKIKSKEAVATPMTWMATISIAMTFSVLALIVTWLVTNSEIPTIYMFLGMLFGVMGMARQQQEMAGIGGILCKTMAWYLAPTLDGLDQASRFFISIGLAAFCEYPFLTFSNMLAMRTKTAMRLRTIQDAVDVVASFIMIALSGTGTVDVFAWMQMLLALLRVAIATLGPRFLLPSMLVGAHDSTAPPPTLAMHRVQFEILVKIFPQIKTKKTPIEVEDWMDEIFDEFNRAPVPSFCNRMKLRITKGFILCTVMSVVGVTMGLLGMFLTTGPYVVGIAAIFGMGLAWYLGPSLEDYHFIARWAVSVLFLSVLEYPFLSEANHRAAISMETFKLRAAQDLMGMLVSTMLISVLSGVVLNRVDVLQLSVGVFRLAVATRFFGTV